MIDARRKALESMHIFFAIITESSVRRSVRWTGRVLCIFSDGRGGTLRRQGIAAMWGTKADRHLYYAVDLLATLVLSIQGASIAAMLSAIGLDPTKVAVERNRAIVPRSTLGEVAVGDGDAFEIVHLVGGG